jgi:hypothetical protein
VAFEYLGGKSLDPEQSRALIRATAHEMWPV